MVESVKQLGRIGFDLEKGTYWGEVLHLCAAETFQAGSIDELRQLLHESMLNRHEEGRLAAAPQPDMVLASVVIEGDAVLFQRLSQQAMLCGKSLNQYILDFLEEVAERSPIPEAV